MARGYPEPSGTRHDRPIGLYRTELIKKDGPWKAQADVDLATADYVDWFNTRRLHTAVAGTPPDEHEAAYYAQTQHPQLRGALNN